jgi:hypothetical protein
MLQFHPIAIPGIFALACAWSLAVVVWITGPGLRRDRLLALLLVLEGTAWASGTGFMYLMASRAAAWYMQAIFVGALLAMPASTLAFAGTLPSTLMAPLRTRTALVILLVLTLAIEVYYLSDPGRFVGAIIPAWYATWDADLPPITIKAFNAVGLAGVVSFIAAISAWLQSAPGSAAKRQARAFAIAFGVHDVGLFLVMVLPGNLIPPPPSGHLTDVFDILGANVITIGFVLLLSYGILEFQLFDIDLRIKRGIRRSTVAAVFVAVFFVVEQIAQGYLSARFGLLLGAVAAGLTLFAFSHIHRFAEGVANGAMPNVAPTPEYLAYRKFEVYRAAYEDLCRDSVVSDKERAMLDHLRSKLGIEARDAVTIENEVRGAAASIAAGVVP